MYLKKHFIDNLKQLTMHFLFLLLIVPFGNSQRLCGSLCDGDPSSSARNPRSVDRTIVFDRIIEIRVSDNDNVAFGAMSNGNSGDEVWLDRSFDGGLSWSDNSRIGNAVVPQGAQAVTTPAFNLDGDIKKQQIGAIRACGKTHDRDDTVCTQWVRSNVLSDTPIKAAATALMQLYNSEGLWKTIGWWNGANALTSLIYYIRYTQDKTYDFALQNTYDLNINGWDGHYLSQSIDDTAWWGLVWLEAYRITNNPTFLDNAVLIADYMHTFVDDQCGGGIWWSAAKTYKNAVTNELFMKLTAALDNVLNGNTKYGQWALENWQWFLASGMINEQGLINDGIDMSCNNNRQETWTYNQGIVLGGLAELYKASGDEDYLRNAERIATAVLNSDHLSPNGILHEPCDNGNSDCGPDAPVFKGVFARNLLEFIEAARETNINVEPFVQYINHNADVILQGKSLLNQYGLHYEGPFAFFTASTHQSAFEMVLASWKLNN